MLTRKEFIATMLIAFCFIAIFLYLAEPYRMRRNMWAEHIEVCKRNNYPEYLYVDDKIICKKLENSSDVLTPTEELK